MENKKEIKGCIFDLDGLLLDTELIYAEALQEFLDVVSPGKKYTLDLKLKIMGASPEVGALVLIKELELPFTTEEFLTKRKPILHSKFPECKAMPGAEKLIEHLHKNKIPIAIATSSAKETFGLKTKKHKFIELVDEIITSDKIKNSKPDPEIFLLAAKNLNLSPAECLVFEDSLNGVAAGINGGFPVIHVPDPELDLSLRQKLPAQTLSSLLDFDPTFWNLPSYN
ncbi:2-deoxyglucose-6-phosphate phosphatase 2 [Anaeramoeba ignava]|uniref:2-deoxyglucose-6-phosphate phosphatase 2 n=1 Tax=Anaeramoeba ignava TaxID=1746090 RepID=A0A9Q0LEC1_ANAIG|nr:2-deoxyglucose-6-phosphate phosphatase 2 [Anaeramoeba ignava]